MQKNIKKSKKIINFWKNFDKLEYWNSENMREYILKIKNKNSIQYTY